MTGSFYALRAKIQLYGPQRIQTPAGLQSICHIPELPFKKGRLTLQAKSTTIKLR
jgi:hypothetical protein